MAEVGIIVGVVCGVLLLLTVVIVLYIYFRPRATASRRDSALGNLEEGAADDSDDRNLDPVPVMIGHNSGGQRRLTSKRRKMDYIVDAVLGKAYPKEKEIATVHTCGIHIVDHHFVHGVLER
jgi:hypothetical protein